MKRRLGLITGLALLLAACDVHPMTPTPGATETLPPVVLLSVTATATAVPPTLPSPTRQPQTSVALETDPPTQSAAPILASDTPTAVPVIAVSVAVNPAPTVALTLAAALAAPSDTPVPPVAAAPPASAEVAAGELYCVDLINAERAKAGVPPLAADETLMSIARARVADMVARNYTGHNDPVTGLALGPALMQAAGYGSYVGENWYGSSKPPPAIADVAMRWFMTDAPHYRNILSPNYTGVGVGIAFNGRQWLLVQDFAGR